MEATIPVKLLDLEIGDLFQFVNDDKKEKTTYIVIGNHYYNNGYHGRTRHVKSKRYGIESKSCKHLVYKTGVSKHADKWKKTPLRNWVNL